MKTSMSARRLLSLFAALALVVVVLLTVQARITASKVVSSPQAAVDQAGGAPSTPRVVARDQRYSQGPRHTPPSATVLAEQARLESRRGDSNVVSSPQDAVDQAGRSSSQPYYRPAANAAALRIAIDNFDASRAGEQLGTVKTAIDVTKDASQLLQEKMDKFNLVLQP